MDELKYTPPRYDDVYWDAMAKLELIEGRITPEQYWAELNERLPA